MKTRVDVKLTHLRLLVGDFRSMFLFYRDVLNLEVAWGDENGPYSEFYTGGSKISLFNKAAMADVAGTSGHPERVPQQDGVALILTTGDVDSVYDELKRRGVKFVTEPMDRSGWGVRTAHFRDPEGNLLEINSDLST